MDACASHPGLTDVNLGWNLLDCRDITAIGRLLSPGRIRTLDLVGNPLFGSPWVIRDSSWIDYQYAMPAFCEAIAGNGTSLPPAVKVSLAIFSVEGMLFQPAIEIPIALKLLRDAASSHRVRLMGLEQLW